MLTHSATCHLLIPIVIVDIAIYECWRARALSFFSRALWESNALSYLNQNKRNRLIAVNIDTADDEVIIAERIKKIGMLGSCSTMI